MKRKFKFYAAVLFSFVMLFSFESCNKSQFSNNRNVSSATGWAINNKKGGFQYNTNYKGQQTPPNMVLVEGGTYTKGRVQDDPMRDWNNSPNQQHVQSFYMDQTEVTNVMYLEYLDWLKRNEDYDVYMGALPDTLVWRNKLGYAEEMVNSYLRHPAFSDYPVVGVSWVQAYEYAEWRTDRYQELILENSGWLSKGATLTDKGGKIANNDSLIKSGNFNQDAYVQIPNKSFGGEDNIEGWSELLKGSSSRKESNRIANIKGVSADSIAPSSANRETGLITPKFRLPTESEWEYAALGLKEVREFNETVLSLIEEIQIFGFDITAIIGGKIESFTESVEEKIAEISLELQDFRLNWHKKIMMEWVNLVKKFFNAIGLGAIFDLLTLTWCDFLKLIGMPFTIPAIAGVAGVMSVKKENKSTSSRLLDTEEQQKFVDNEVNFQNGDGTTTSFSIPSASGTLKVFRDGSELSLGTDYTIASGNVVLSSALSSNQSVSILKI